MDAAGSRHCPEKPEKVHLFGTCLIDLFCPEAGMNAVRLLEREGIEVLFPADQTCCGQPAHSSGFPEQARAVALAQFRLFPEAWPVIVPSGSCAGTMRRHYPAMFADDPRLLAQATALAERVFEFSEFLVHVARVTLGDQGGPARVALHTSCAARREMGTHEHARSLLAQLAAVEVVLHEHESECCGFGGTFSLKHPAISSAMAGDKVDALKETGAETFVSADCGCMLSLNHTLQKRRDGFQGQHLATFLWQRTGGEGGAAMSARDRILQRLRAAPQGKAPLAPDVPAFYDALGAAAPAGTRASRIALFCEKMAFWHGEVVRVTRDKWPQKLHELCLAKGVRSLLYGPQSEHAAALVAAGIDGLKPYDRPVGEWKKALFEDTDAGLTATRGGIAETGTLIVWPDASEPRLMSLVPPIHFALLDADQLHDTLFDAMRVQRWSDGMPTNALLVSGPSKTADIQVTLAYGAHGPKELVVLLLVNEEEMQ